MLVPVFVMLCFESSPSFGPPPSCWVDQVPIECNSCRKEWYRPPTAILHKSPGPVSRVHKFDPAETTLSKGPKKTLRHLRLVSTTLRY